MIPSNRVPKQYPREGNLDRCQISSLDFQKIELTLPPMLSLMTNLLPTSHTFLRTQTPNHSQENEHLFLYALLEQLPQRQLILSKPPIILQWKEQSLLRLSLQNLVKKLLILVQNHLFPMVQIKTRDAFLLLLKHRIEPKKTSLLFPLKKYVHSLLLSLIFLIRKKEMQFSSSYSDASCSDRTEATAEDKAYGSDLACCYSLIGVESQGTPPKSKGGKLQALSSHLNDLSYPYHEP